MQTLKPQPVTEVFAECKSKVTRKQYPPTLKRFFDYLQLLPGQDVDTQGQTFLDEARQDPEYANSKIKAYILANRERVETGEITAGTLKGMFTPIKIFCDGFDDITIKINWRRIKKLIPAVKAYADDRAPTKEEIQKVCEFPDRRIKAIVYTMASSGIRIGAWENMKVKHIKPIQNDKTGEVIAAQLQVYGREAGNYKTFMTAEAYNEIKKWLDFRAMYGETITGESLVMRNIWRTSDVKRRTTNDKRGGANGLAQEPKKLETNALARLLVRALYEQGLRESLGEGEKRHETHGSHGYRKYFKTAAEYAGMKSIYVELLMGHSLGISASYLRIPEEDLLKEYIKIAPALTFNENIQTLKQQQEQQEQEVEETKKTLDVMRRNAERTEKQLEDMSKQIQDLRAVIDKGTKQVDETLQAQEEEDQILADLKKRLAQVERSRGQRKSSSSS